MSPGQLALKGREEIRQMLLESSKIPGFEVSLGEPKEVFVSESGDL